ncbi:MAG: hypothetical protein M3076_09065 [Actinomycetota bacterium]|nr:hypothetical protein [Actinomycetota bacterium]
MAPDLGLRLLAEAIGTALLVVFGAGTVLAALTIGKGKPDYAGLGSPPRDELSVYVVGPLVGAGLAALLYDFVARPERVGVAAEAAQDAAGTVEGRAPGEDVPVGAPEDVTRTGRFQGAGGDIGRARE